ncbi:MULTISPECIES: CHAT domain-containing protein [unclassified Microcoleus]|uniref:CHAT domain-containing protein n=1 Tax=unclassified Microcoleus TaxID=2642155 RepID=UPI002FD1EB51
MTDPIYIKTSISIDYKQLEALADNSHKLSVFYLQESYLPDVDRIKCLKDADQAITNSLTVKDLLRDLCPDDQSKRDFDKNNNPFLVQKIKISLHKQNFCEALEFLERSKARVLAERINERNQEKYEHITFEKVKSLVDNYTAILEWFVFDKDCLGVFIVLPKEERPKCILYPDINWQMLESWADAYHKSYYTPGSEWRDRLEQRIINLGSILQLETIIRDHLPNSITNLILIPHRYLHLFPLHAIPVSPEIWQRFHPNNQNCPLNPCLVDCFDNGVSYAPSCQLLHQVQKYKRGKFERFFAIQNPTNDLSAADMEVETIKNIFPSPEIFAKHNAKKGEQSESKLEIAEKVADSHHLFFSCHGSFDPNDPLQSGLELADGTLTLEEIIGYFNLSQCSLVTLSACETGRVQLDNTDEYISLTSGFLLAGSPSLYVSLWSVNPLSTAILLIKTYENLYHQPGKFALALSQAQIWMRDTDIQGFLDWTNQCHLLDTDWRGTLQCLLEKDKATQGLCAKIYQNPFHWAGFCAAGKAEQNMTNSSNKIEIFQQLIQSDFFFNLRYALASLKAELTDNDDNNVELIENWLQDKPAIKFQYRARVMKSEEVKLPNKGQSATKPGQQSQILKETLENLTIAAEKPPEANQDTPSSP